MNKAKKQAKPLQIDAAVENITLQGTSVFYIETIAAGIAVQTALLTEDQASHIMPAVFPTLQIALQQIDQLRAHIINHFENAAQVGAKVIADNATQSNAQVTVDNTTKPTDGLTEVVNDSFTEESIKTEVAEEIVVDIEKVDADAAEAA